MGGFEQAVTSNYLYTLSGDTLLSGCHSSEQQLHIALYPLSLSGVKANEFLEKWTGSDATPV